MASGVVDSSFALLNFGYGLVGKTAVLSFVLLFFLVVHGLIVFFNRRLSPSKVKGTIVIALAGFAVLLLETRVGFPPPYEGLPGNALSLIALICAANFLTYMIVDVFLYFRADRQVPSHKRDLTTAVVYILAAVAALRYVFRLDIGSILTTTTVLTAAVAFAMQTTLANIVSSFYVQNDENLRRSTWVSLPGMDVEGEVVNVGFRYTTLRTIDNQKILLPNNHIMQNVVRTLGTRGGGEKVAVHLKVGLGYDMPPETAIGILSRILAQEEHIVKTPAPTVCVSGFLDSSIEYDLKYYLDDYSHQRPVRGSILNKSWYAVVREGHSVPYPHREVIAKTPREPFPEEGASVLETLRKAEILGSLDAEETRKLSERVGVRVFGPGEMVVRQDDEGDSLFIVRRGSLSVRIGGSTVGNLAEGDIFGEMSLLTGEKRKATVSAATEVRLIEISKADIEPLVRANPRLLESLSAILAKRQEANIERMKSAEARKAQTGKDVFLEKLKTFFGISPG